MIFRIYHDKRGGHVHMRLFAGKKEGALGKCGDLCMREDEFVEFVKRIAFIDLRAESDPQGTWLHGPSYDPAAVPK